MEAVSVPLSAKLPGGLKAILAGGFFAGVLDLTAACVVNGLMGVSPIRVFQAISSGLLGSESYKGGAATAALGVFLHFVIAFGATIVFYFASRKIKFMTHQAIVSGLLYGIAIYWFMELVVLPLSAFTGKNRFSVENIVTGLIIHTLCVGLPIALAVRRYANLDK